MLIAAPQKSPRAAAAPEGKGGGEAKVKFHPEPGRAEQLKPSQSRSSPLGNNAASEWSKEKSFRKKEMMNGGRWPGAALLKVIGAVQSEFLKVKL